MNKGDAIKYLQSIFALVIIYDMHQSNDKTKACVQHCLGGLGKMAERNPGCELGKCNQNKQKNFFVI